MWICQKCGREFKRVNQDHYCGKAPESVDEYIGMQVETARPHLAELRNIIRSAAPEARERIAWSMPTFDKGKKRVSFAACKNHVSLYVDIAVLEIFQAQLGEFTIRKNAVYLPYDSALPTGIIEAMIRQFFENECTTKAGND